MQGPLGGKVLGPQNVPEDLQNTGALASPSKIMAMCELSYQGLLL